MLFVIECRDKPGHEAVRAATRDRHLAYIDDFAEHVVLAGPLLTEDGQGMVGSLLIMRFDDRAQAQAFCSEDPYGKAGLFGTVTITPWRQVRPA